MRSKATGLVAILSVYLTLAMIGWAQGDGIIEGQVLNASLGDSPVQGATVILRVWSGDEQRAPLEETTDDQGQFRFEGLDTQTHRYQLRVDHEGIAYGFDIEDFPEGENLLSLPISVYDTTTSDDALLVERAHLIIDYRAGVLDVQEVLIIANRGKTTYVGPQGEEGQGTIRFSLPPAAADLQLPDEWTARSVVMSEDGFAYTLPILPGTKEFFFSYAVPITSSSYVLSKPIIYSTKHLDVFLAESDIAVTAPGLVSQETLTLQGGRYRHLSGSDLPAGSTLALHFTTPSSEAVQAERGGGGSRAMMAVVIGLVVLVALLVVVYPFFKHRHGKETR